MSHSTPKAPPSLNDLLVGFVNRDVDADAIEAEAGALGEVQPHEVAVGFRVDPGLAWREGMCGFEAFGLNCQTTQTPSDWAAVVVRHDATASQPFAIGCYPQRVRELGMLLQAKDLAAFRKQVDSKSASPALKKWATKHGGSSELTEKLLAMAVLRSAGDLDAAEDLLPSASSDPVVENERATMLWQRGEWEKAQTIWDRLSGNSAVWFNQGMAALFLKQPAKARESLKKAIGNLPESSGWHHLASLYLALADIKK